jgi:phage antirepressor YoqD-like protein
MTQAIQIARQERAGRLEAEGRLAIGAPKIALVDTYVKQGDASTFAVVAGQLGVTAPQLRQYLVTRGVIYRRTVEQRWSTTRQKLEPVYEWLARSQYTKWFTPKDQLRAPRMHNGQYRTTLYFTPIGKAGVELMIRKRPILGQGELDVDGGGS